MSRHQHSRVWQLAWPMILSNLSVPLLGAVDTAILGHLDSPRYLGAVAVGASILSLLFWPFGFLRMGTTSLVARACGRDDQDAARLLLAQSLILAGTIAVGLLALQGLIIPLGLSLMQPPPEVAPLAHSYVQIRLWSAPATLFSYALIGWFIGQQDTRAPLLILLATNLLNIALDWLLIVHLGWASDGAALASVLAEYTGLGLALWLLSRKLRHLGGQWHWAPLRRLQRYRELLVINRQLLIRTLCLLGVFAFFTAQGARQGELLLAANAVLLQWLFFAAHALDGFAHAAEALSGKAIGGGRRQEFFAVCRAAGMWALGIALLLSAGFALAQPWLIPLFTGIDEVAEQVRRHYLWVCLLPLVSVWAYLLDGIFLGSGKTAALQYTVLAAAGLVFVPLWWFSLPLGNQGLWLALSAFNLARGLLLGAWFYYLTRHQRWLPSAATAPNS